jgi:hypothetical protein
VTQQVAEGCTLPRSTAIHPKNRSGLMYFANYQLDLPRFEDARAISHEDDVAEVNADMMLRNVTLSNKPERSQK